MIKDGEVRPEGCICEPCSDIMTKWRDMRSKFGYTTLYAIVDREIKIRLMLILQKKVSV